MKIDRFEHSKKFISNPGNPLHPVRHGEVKDDGTIELVTDRLEDTDQIIDSYRESTEIYNIMARIESGEIGLLNQREGFFGDVTQLPKTYAEMLNLMHKGEEFFSKLPVEVKEKYNNDFNQFFADFDNAIKELMPKDKEKAEEVVSEVNTEV